MNTSTVTRVFSQVGMKLSKHSPHILIASGIIAMGAGVVSAALETSAASENEELAAHLGAWSTVTSETVEDKRVYISAKGILGAKIAKNFLFAYRKTLLFTTCGAALIVSGHAIQTRRYLGLVAAYSAVDRALKNYKAGVAEVFGSEGVRKMQNWVNERSQDEFVPEEAGDDKPIVKDLEDLKAMGIRPHRIDIEGLSPYARVYGPGCEDWEGNRDHDEIMLSTTQAYFNDRLVARGHVFLNEVYDALGISRTPAGAVVGWTYDRNGDNYMDLNIGDYIDDYVGDGDSTEVYRSWIIDPNVQGVIWDQI